MKHALSIIALLILTSSVNAQQKVCTLNDGNLHEVYVFSENRNHTMTDLFGERINPMVINLVYITTPKSKKEMDEKILSGEMLDGTFIFPSNDATKTIRYCNAKEYAEALNRKEKLEIEKMQPVSK